MATKQLPALPEATTAEDNDLLLKRDESSGSDQKLSIETLRDQAFGDAAVEDASVTPTADTLAKRDGVGRIQAASGGSGNEAVVHADTSTSANADTVAKRDGSGRIKSASGGSGLQVVTHSDLPTGGLELLGKGTFAKENRDSVVWQKTGNGAAQTGQAVTVEVDGSVLTIASGTAISMPTLTAGTDYAIWCAPDGTLEADNSFTTAPTANGRLIGGFHYAPGGNATFGLDEGDGGTTAQINEYSFWDLRWRPSVIDPRGLTLVGYSAFWAGMYHMSANHLTGPVHKYGVNPCRDGNPPQNINGTGNYPNAEPSNIIEALQYHGFRAPNYWEFQLLAFGVKEEQSIGGSNPGDTGDVSDRDKDQQTSAWGVFDATGVLWHWGNDTILTTSDQDLPNPSRGDRFRYSHFARFGGDWDNGSDSGSRDVDTRGADNSLAAFGSRGVCDHLILD